MTIHARAPRCLTIAAILFTLVLAPPLAAQEGVAVTPAPVVLRDVALLAGAVEVPVRSGYPLVLSARGETSTSVAPLRLGSWRGTTAAALRTTRGSVWLAYAGSAIAAARPSSLPDDSGRTERAGSVLDRDMLHELSLGASRRIGQLLLSASAGGAWGVVRDEVASPARTVTDSVWSDTSGWVSSVHEVGGGRTARAIASRWMTGAVNASWSRERFALTATVGGWMPSADRRGSGWGAVEFARRIQPGVWLVAGAGVRPDVSRVTAAPAAYSMAGLRFAYAAHGERGDVAAPADAGRTFTITRAGTGSYAIALRAPDAKQVEISGDFTGWTAVALVPAQGGWWVATVRLAPGTHRMNVRVDGGSWYPPPGTTPVADDFGGSAGLVVVSER